MFKPDTSNVVVVSTPTKIVDIQKGFEGLGFGIKSVALNDINVDAF